MEPSQTGHILNHRPHSRQVTGARLNGIAHQQVMRLLPHGEVRDTNLAWVRPGGCFTNVSQAPQNILAKIHTTRNHIYGENFNLKICTCAQSMALGTRTKFQLEILIRSMISAIHKFQENILESSRNVSETTPCVLNHCWSMLPELIEAEWCIYASVS